MSYIVIRTIKQGFCLQDSTDGVRIHYFSGADPQLWLLQGTELGTFFIRNKKNGYVSQVVLEFFSLLTALTQLKTLLRFLTVYLQCIKHESTC